MWTSDIHANSSVESQHSRIVLSHQAIPQLNIGSQANLISEWAKWKFPEKEDVVNKHNGTKNKQQLTLNYSVASMKQ